GRDRERQRRRDHSAGFQRRNSRQDDPTRDPEALSGRGALCIYRRLHHGRTPGIARRVPRCGWRRPRCNPRRGRGTGAGFFWREFALSDHTGGNSLAAWNSAKNLQNIFSVSITSVKPACISLIVETIAGGPGALRPKPMV